MAMRIDVVAGYLNASRKNFVSGKIELADGQVVWLELSGNLQASFPDEAFPSTSIAQTRLNKILPVKRQAVRTISPLPARKRKLNRCWRSGKSVRLATWIFEKRNLHWFRLRS